MPMLDNVQRTNVPNSGALRHVNLKKELTTAGELPLIYLKLMMSLSCGSLLTLLSLIAGGETLRRAPFSTAVLPSLFWSAYRDSF
jgi:hypothetical protein